MGVIVDDAVIAEWKSLLNAGRIRRNPQTIAYPYWYGSVPHRDQCVEIDSYDHVPDRFGMLPKVQVGSGGSLGYATDHRAEFRVTDVTLAEQARNYALDNMGFEWAVTFDVLCAGELRGTWFGNRWGWEFVPA